MSTVQVQVLDQGRLARAEKLLAGVPNGVQRAMKAAMVRAVSHLRANTVKAIQQRYDISAGNIRANENVTVRYTYQDGVQAFVNFKGGRIPLFRYGGASPGAPTPLKDRWVKVADKTGPHWYHPSVPAHGHQLKSTSPTLFQHAFVARMGSGHVGIFQRDGGTSRSGGDSISEIMGGTVPGMLGKDEVKEKLGEQAAGKYMERYHHEVVRLLNGWGG